MAGFPLSNDDAPQEALNYLLSGPAGLGQNFAGFSSYTPAYLTGNYRLPFSQPGVAQLYIAPIPCSSAVQLDDRTFQYNFSSPVIPAPFSNGNQLTGDGWANDFYNGEQGVIGVVECTTTYVIFRTNNYYPGTGDDTGGGTVEVNNVGVTSSTDCDVRVTVTGGTDRVFISGQLDETVSYTGSGNLTATVQINRYVGLLNNDPINPDYIFVPDATVAEKVYSYTTLTTGSRLIETVFSTLIDTPKPGFYRYILEVTFTPTGSLVVNTDQLKLRSISAQVVKQ